MPGDVASTAILAHGIGGRRDLPIPFDSVLIGGGVAVAVSFAALLFLWPSSRLKGAAAGRPLPGWIQAIADSGWARWALRLLGLLVTGFTAVAAIFGKNDELNPTATFVYVFFWVGLVFASIVFGPVWRAMNPLRTIHLGISALLRRRPEAGFAALPDWVGYWPGALSLLAFTWLELAGGPNRDTTPVLITWFGIYCGVHLAAAIVFGSRWFDRCDGFELYSTLAATICPIGRRDDGKVVLRNPFDGLDAIEPGPGLVGTVAVMFGSTAFDGGSASTWWVNHAQSGSLSPDTANALGLIGTVVIVGLSFTLVLRLAGRIGGADQDEYRGGAEEPFTVPPKFAHSIVPIAVGYVIAHYFSLLVFNGQSGIKLASDPLGTGANLFGTADWGINYTAVNVRTIALVQVFGVVIGHILGTVSAHDRAVRLFPRKHAVLGQIPMLLLMIAYTIGGLLLLFSS